METVLLLILLLSPLVGFGINLCFGNKLGKTLSGTIANLAVLVSFLISIYFFAGILSTGEAIHVNLFPWLDLRSVSIDFAFVLDQLSILWLLFVTGIGFLIHIYSIGYMEKDENISKFFAYLNLFIFFMAVLVTGSNLLIMFVGWEGVGLCSYLLIGFWYKNQNYNDAAKKAFIMNRIGDMFFLLGVFTLIYLFNTVDFDGLKVAVSSTNDIQTTGLLALATFSLFIGATGKSAQLPLYTWLPDAMAGPTPVSALIHAATMVTGGIFMISRLNFLFELTPDVLWLIAIVGAVTALFAATIAIVQTDIKKVLAYSTVSQLGLMFLAIGCGAYHVAVFHVITHAFFKACLFLGAGSVIHGVDGEQDMRKMGGLRKKMIVTFTTFLIATMAISGIPLFSGFFSKDEIMLVAFEKNIILWAVGALASLLTAIYMFRALFLTFCKEFRGTKEAYDHVHESPKTMTLPLIILAVLSVVGGVIALPFGYNWLNEYLLPIMPEIASHAHAEPSAMWTVMAISTVIAFAGLFIAWAVYMKKSDVPADDKEKSGLIKVLYNKYYIDEIYDTLFVKPCYILSRFFNKWIEVAVSGIVVGVARTIDFASYPMRRLQNGSLGFYLFCFVLGFCGIVIGLFLV